MPHMFMLEHLIGGMDLAREENFEDKGVDIGHLPNRRGVACMKVRQLSIICFISGKLQFSGHNVLRVVLPHCAAADPGHRHPVCPEQAPAR